MSEALLLTTVLTPAAAKKLMRGHLTQGRYAGADNDRELSAIVPANLKLIIGSGLHPTSFPRLSGCLSFPSAFTSTTTLCFPSPYRVHSDLFRYTSSGLHGV